MADKPNIPSLPSEHFVSIPKEKHTHYILSKLEALWTNKETCDVSFFVGDERKEIKAHAALIAIHSPVLTALLFGPLKEGEEKKVVIADCNHNDFAAFLEYLYTGTLKLDGDNVMGVRILGHKYQIAPIQEACDYWLSESITPDNVVSVLHFALYYSADDLIKKCEEFIAANCKQVLSGSGFTKAPKETVSHIIKLEDLRISEADLFHALSRWAKTMKATTKEIQELKVFLRPHLLSVEEIIRFVKPSGWFTAEEIIEVIEFRVAPDLVPKSKKSQFQPRMNLSTEETLVFGPSVGIIKDFSSQGSKCVVENIRTGEKDGWVALTRGKENVDISFGCDVMLTKIVMKNYYSSEFEISYRRYPSRSWEILMSRTSISPYFENSWTPEKDRQIIAKELRLVIDKGTGFYCTSWTLLNVYGFKRKIDE